MVNKAPNPRRLPDVAGYRMKWAFQDEGRGAYRPAMAGSRELLRLPLPDQNPILDLIFMNRSHVERSRRSVPRRSPVAAPRKKLSRHQLWTEGRPSLRAPR